MKATLNNVIRQFLDLGSRQAVEMLAEILHKNYRAAYKALCDGHQPGMHDHGYQNCQSKKYFRLRAKRLLGE
jgi:hypothetical protein